MDSAARRVSSVRLTSVNSGRAPEDLFIKLGGSFTYWQWFIIITVFFSEFFHGFNLFSWSYIVPHHMKYKCSNGTKCFTSNGSKCTQFVFQRHYRMQTWNEKYLLVCDREPMVMWLHFGFRVGLIFGNLIVGFLTDRYGRKQITILFIPALSCCGLLIICSPMFEVIVASVSLFEIFASHVNLTGKVALCSVVGNKWRSLAIGIIMLPVPTVELILPPLIKVLTNGNGLVAILTVLPLMLLVPYLYTKNSPNWTFIKRNMEDATKSLRAILRFNKKSFSEDCKICPVEVLEGDEPKHEKAIIGLWKRDLKTAAAFTSIIWIFYLTGFLSKSLITSHAYQMTSTYWHYGLLALGACVISIVLIHLYVPHNVIILFFGCSTSLLLGTYYNFTTEYTTNIFPKLSYLFVWILIATTDNLAARMFPTIVRNFGLGMCYSAFHLGMLTGRLTPIELREQFWFSVLIYYIIVPVTSLLSAWQMPRVHMRELPDYIEDAINFRTFYKPKRYVLIDEMPSGSITEKEVKLIELETASSRRNAYFSPAVENLQQTP